MRRLPTLFLVLLLCTMLASPAFAEEVAPENPVPEQTEPVETIPEDSVSDQTETETETVVVDTESDPQNITVNVNLPTATDDPDVVSDPVEEVVVEDPALYPVVMFASLDETVSEEQTMKYVIEELFGVYTPRTQTVTQILSDGSQSTYTEVVPGLGGLDWSWIASVSLFGLMLYALLRMIGGLLSR